MVAPQSEMDTHARMVLLACCWHLRFSLSTVQYKSSLILINCCYNAESVEKKQFKYKCCEVACAKIIRQDKWKSYCKSDRGFKFAHGDDITFSILFTTMPEIKNTATKPASQESQTAPKCTIVNIHFKFFPADTPFFA